MNNLPKVRSKTMRIYPCGSKFVVGCFSGTLIWWYGGGIASESLCTPKYMTKKQADKALPVAVSLLKKSNEAQY